MIWDITTYIMGFMARKTTAHRPVVFVLLTVLSLLMSVERPLAMQPSEVAKVFYEHLIRGEMQIASEMVTEADRNWPQPIGYFTPQFEPRFPSLWTVSVESEIHENKQSKVMLRVSYPEIEDVISKVGIKGSITERVLQEYFNQNLPMSHFELSIELVFENGVDWRVKTSAEDYAWYMDTHYPPQVNLVNPNISEIRAYQKRLLKKFPRRLSEIEEISAPLLAKAYAAAGAVFSDTTIDPNNPRWRKGVYDIGFTYENRSDFVVESLDVAIILFDASREIVQRVTTQVFYSGDLPQGLPPHGKLVEHYPLDVIDSKKPPAFVEIQIVDLQARPQN